MIKLNIITMKDFNLWKLYLLILCCLPKLKNKFRIKLIIKHIYIQKILVLFNNKSIKYK